MDMLKRFDDVKNFIEKSERDLVDDSSGDFEEFEKKRDKIFDDYRTKELEVIARYERDRATLDGFYDQARTLVEGIRRRLFVKQRRQVRPTSVQDDPEEALNRLRREIGSFEATILPHGIKQLVDSITLLFNSSYGQEEVDRIVSLYNSVERIRESDQLEKSRDAEILRLRNECSYKVKSLEKMVTTILDDRVDSYISDLDKRIFS